MVRRIPSSKAKAQKSNTYPQQAEIRDTRTTTLRITTGESCFEKLNEHFKLVRYDLPMTWQEARKSTTYAEIYNAFYQRFDQPLRVFTKFNNGKNWVVYVLYQKIDKIKNIVIDSLSPRIVPKRIISFTEIESFNLIKLFQAAYSRGMDSVFFSGQGNCYIYVRQSGANRHTCLEIELKGAKGQNISDSTQTYTVKSHACHFRRETTPKSYRTYYAFHIEPDKPPFVSRLKQCVANEYIKHFPIFFQKGYPDNPARLDYHSQTDITQSRGYLILSFIQGFTEYLTQLGFQVETAQRRFTGFIPTANSALPTDKLTTIHVYDLRREKKKYPLADYLSVFTKTCKKIGSSVRFQALLTEPSTNLEGPLLILQDYRKKDFEKNGFYFGDEDPYRTVRSRLIGIPIQSLNVNSHRKTKRGMERHEYEQYPMLVEGKKLQRLFQVILNELVLKDIILRERSLQEYKLPFAPINMVFVRKRTVEGNRYETMLYFEEGKIRCVDLKDPEAREQRNLLAAAYNLDWSKLYTQMWQRYKPRQEEPLANFDIIMMPNQFIEIADCDETILYEYEKIISRQEKRTKQYLKEELYLLPYYDRLRGDRIKKEDIEGLGLMDRPEKWVLGREREARDFYLHLQDIDEVIKRHGQRRLSIKDLSQGELGESLARLFNIASLKDEKGKPDREALKLFNGKLYRFYRNLEMLESPKAKDLMLYQGIWYTADSAYMVGDVRRLNDKQPRAHLVRQFICYQGADDFQIEPLLQTMGVTFVRLNQYTVYPYYFHLLDMYVANVLRFQPST